MGQLTLLKNVQESGGGGFEKLYESVLNSASPYDVFPDRLTFNPLEYDVLVFWLTNLYFDVSLTSTAYNYLETIIYLQNSQYDEYHNTSTPIYCGKVKYSGRKGLGGDPYTRGSGGAICLMGKSVSDECVVFQGGYRGSETSSPIMSMDMKYVALNRPAGYQEYNADVKLTIYGMGKRK